VARRTEGIETVDFHDEVMAVYRVSPDPDGTVLVPGGLLGPLLERMGQGRRLPRSEAALIRGLSPVRQLTVAAISRDAARRSTRAFGKDGFYGGHTDAFRHVYWNARLAQRFGVDWTRRLTTAHERLPAADPIAVAMDLHNNEVGRRIGSAHPGLRRSRLAAEVEAAVRGGQAVEIGPVGRLRRIVA
jgi:hypothetical protein